MVVLIVKIVVINIIKSNMELEKLIKESKPKPKTKEELLQENLEIEELLRILRKSEEELQGKLRVALDALNAKQSQIEITEELFDKNCFELQELNKKI